MTLADLLVFLLFLVFGCSLAWGVSRVLLGLGTAVLADAHAGRSELPRATGRLVATIALLVGAGVVLLLLDAQGGQVASGEVVQRQAVRLGLVLLALALVLGVGASWLAGIRQRALWEREQPPVPGEREGAPC